MAINRDIVATRKLNKKNKARLRSTGDTELGFINGRLSHINNDEKRRLTAADAYDISLRERVESDIASEGAGTTNPFTGMPEYHTEQTAPHKHDNPADEYSSYMEWSTGLPRPGNVAEDKGEAGKVGYEGFELMDPSKKASYLESFDVGRDEQQYISEFETKPFEFLGTEKTMAGEFALGAKDITEKGLDITKRAAGREAEIATAGIQETLTGARESLGREFAAGSRGIGQSMVQARSGAETAAVRSGFARPGTVTGALGQQMKALTQDYGQLQKGLTQGMAAAGRRADIGLAGVAAGEKTAAESYALGMEGAEFEYGKAIDIADFGFESGTYTEKQRQMDKLWNEIGTVSQM